MIACHGVLVVRQKKNCDSYSSRILCSGTNKFKLNNNNMFRVIKLLTVSEILFRANLMMRIFFTTVTCYLQNC